MKRFWSGVITAAVVATVGLGAQAGQSSPPAPAGAGAGQAGQGAAAPAQAGAQKIMVSGCVENAPPAAGAAAGAAPTFILADAKMAGAAEGGRAVGTTGAAATRYELDADAKTISAHLNHQVEITGTLQSSAAAPAGAPGAARGGAGASAPRLKVESVKMVSATCS